MCCVTGLQVLPLPVPLVLEGKGGSQRAVTPAAPTFPGVGRSYFITPLCSSYPFIPLTSLLTITVGVNPTTDSGLLS